MDISTSEINSIFSVFRDAVNKSVYFNLGIDGAALTITDFRFQYSRIDLGNADNNSVSAVISVTAGTFGGAHVDNQGSFAGTTGQSADALLRLDLPDAAFAANADTVIVSLSHVSDDTINAQIAIKILHPSVLSDVIEERSGISSAAISKAGTPGNQQYIVIYSAFVSTAFELGLELLSAHLAAAPLDSSPNERELLPILGFYYQDGAGNQSQINGIAASLGVTSADDLSDAGWTGAADEATAGAGYTFICPLVSGYDIPDSFENLFIFYGEGAFQVDTSSVGDWTTTEKEQIRHRINIDGTQSAPVSGGAARLAGTNAELTLQSLKIIQTNSNEDAVLINGNGNGHGIQTVGGNTSGSGIYSTSGTGANGSGIVALSLSTNGEGIWAQGNGFSPGIFAKGGASGSGIVSESGSSNGHGIEATAAGGSGGNGINAQGDLNASSGAHGIEAIGEADGNDIKAKEIGNPYALADGTTSKSLTDMLSEMAETMAGGATFDRTTDSLQAIAAAGGDVEFKKNVAFPNFPIYLVLSSDHVSPAIGLGATVTALVQKDSGAFAAATNAVVEIGSGVYRIDLTAAEMNGDIINLVFSGAGADTRVISFPTNT